MRDNKFRQVCRDNHKREIELVYTSGKKVTVHYAHIGIQAPIRKIWIDKETRGKSIGIELDNGKVEYMPFDQPLALVNDADYLLEHHIELMTTKIRQAIVQEKISKRYLARQLGTSDNQIQRLLNPAILNKNLTQLYRMAVLLGLEMQITLKAA